MTVLEYFELESTSGTFGLELELETYSGVNWPRVNGWREEHDGSLRERGIEYVMRTPKSYKQTVEMITHLYSKLEKRELELAITGNAGTHVHLNVQDWEWNQVNAFIYTFFLVEEMLVRWCGEERVGNHFCLTGKDSITQIQDVANNLISRNGVQSVSNHNRYSAMNLASLSRYGSIEIRCMEATSNSGRLIEWVTMLHNIHKYAMNIGTIQDVSDSYKSLGPVGFVKSLGIYKLLNVSDSDIVQCLEQSFARTYVMKMGDLHND